MKVMKLHTGLTILLLSCLTLIAGCKSLYKTDDVNYYKQKYGNDVEYFHTHQHTHYDRYNHKYGHEHTHDHPDPAHNHKHGNLSTKEYKHFGTSAKVKLFEPNRNIDTPHTEEKHHYQDGHGHVLHGKSYEDGHTHEYEPAHDSLLEHKH